MKQQERRSKTSRSFHCVCGAVQADAGSRNYSEERFMLAQTRILTIFAALAALLALASCARQISPGVYEGGHVGSIAETRTGTVQSARVVMVQEDELLQENVLGGAVGGTIGGLAGSAFGKGWGRTASTAGGALAGATLGALAPRTARRQQRSEERRVGKEGRA